jgi:uncharacterized protein YkwD
VTGFVRRAVVAAALLAVPAVILAASSSAPVPGTASALPVAGEQRLTAVTVEFQEAGDLVVEPAIAEADVEADFTPVKASKKKIKKKAKSKKKATKKKVVSAPAPAPAPVQAPAPAPVVESGAYASVEAQVVDLTNQQRAANGCGALRLDGQLTAAARAHSTDMVTRNFFSHTGSDGSNFVTRAQRAGYTAASAENIAWGWSTAEVVVREWMNSPGHRANILNCGSVAVGVGLVKKADGTPYWTQVFGRA